MVEIGSMRTEVIKAFGSRFHIIYVILGGIIPRNSNNERNISNKGGIVIVILGGWGYLDP